MVSFIKNLTALLAATSLTKGQADQVTFALSSKTKLTAADESQSAAPAFFEMTPQALQENNGLLKVKVSDFGVVKTEDGKLVQLDGWIYYNYDRETNIIHDCATNEPVGKINKYGDIVDTQNKFVTRAQNLAKNLKYSSRETENTEDRLLDIKTSTLVNPEAEKETRHLRTANDLPSVSPSNSIADQLQKQKGNSLGN